MKTEINNFPDDANALKSMLFEALKESSLKDKLINQKERKILELEEKLALQLAHRFGSRSEKFINPNQLSLFNEVEEEVSVNAEVASEETEIAISGFTRKRGKRKPIPDNLERVEEFIDIEDEQKTCKLGGELLVRFGEIISEKLEIIPQRIFVRRIVRAKYKCKCCSEENTTFATASLPKEIIPKSMASASLLSYITVSKYVDHLPLHRLEKMFERINVDIPRSTMSRWMIKASHSLTPLYNILEEKLLASKAIQMDETTVQVLKETNKTAMSKSYMWVRSTVPGNGPPIVLYDYHPTRSGEVVDKLLQDFKGILQTDGYGGYDSYCKNRTGVSHAGCFAHTRRKFHEAIKANKTKNNPVARKGYLFFKDLYDLDRKTRKMSLEEIRVFRKEHMIPLIEEMSLWLSDVLPKTPTTLKTGQALTYLNNQLPKLLVTIRSPQLPLDTNFVENKIRPFTLGRKNWLFSDTAKGAEASAMLYSLLETAKANGKEPYAYMQFLFERLPLCNTAEDFEILLPF